MPRSFKVLFLLLCGLLPVQGRVEQTQGVCFTRNFVGQTSTSEGASSQRVVMSGISGGVVKVGGVDLGDGVVRRDTAALMSELTGNRLGDFPELQKELEALREYSEALTSTMTNTAFFAGEAGKYLHAGAMRRFEMQLDKDIAAGKITKEEADAIRFAKQKSFWSDGETGRQMLHAGVTGLVFVAAGASTTELVNAVLGAVASDYLTTRIVPMLTGNKGLQGVSKEVADKLVGSVVSLGIGQAVGGSAGAFTALTLEQYNRQLHPDETHLLRTLSVRDKAKLEALLGRSLTKEEAYQLMLRGTLYANDSTFASYYSDHLSEEELSQMRIAGRFAIEFGANYQRENGLGYFTSTSEEYANYLAGARDWGLGAGGKSAFEQAYESAWVRGTGSGYEGMFKDFQNANAGFGLGVKDGAVELYESFTLYNLWNVVNGKALEAVFDGTVTDAVKGAYAEYEIGDYLYGNVGDRESQVVHNNRLPGNIVGSLFGGGAIAKATAKVAQAAKAAALARLPVPKAVGSGKVLGAAKTIANPVPSTLARVIPGRGPYSALGLPGRSDVFVTAADDIAGLTPAQISERLTIPLSDTFTIIRFPTPPSGVASPILRPDPGFIGGGRTLGGAREFVIPNGRIPSGSTTTIYGP